MALDVCNVCYKRDSCLPIFWRNAAEANRAEVEYHICGDYVDITPMLFIFDHQTEEKMKPICENALQTIENNDAKSWAKQLHPECSEEMRDLKQLRKALAEAGIPEEGEWKVGPQIASEVQSLDGNKRIAVSYQVTKAGKPYVVKIIYLSDSDGEGVFRLSVGIG